MDTTAAAELGMGGDPAAVNGIAFWDSGAVDPNSWGEEKDDSEEDLLWDRAAAIASSQAQALGRQRPPSSSGIEPPPKKRTKSAAEESPGYGPRASPGAGRGIGLHAGKGNSTPGAGAVGRGRGMGSIFYKTKLCSRFRSGNCPYNRNCNFAHGMEELRKPPPGWEEFVASQELPPAMPNQSPSHGGSAAAAAAGSTDSQVRFHRTRPCKKYFGEGNCPYGEKCNFLHDEQSAPRAVREAQETAALLVTPKTEISASLSAEAPVKDTSGSNTGATTTVSAAGSLTVHPPNWKTRVCNKWETTGDCPFGDKCYFAHGSDELQRYGGGPVDPNAPALTLSDSGGTSHKSSSETGIDSSLLSNYAGSHGRQLNGQGYSVGFKAFSNWKGSTQISTIYGDWIDEEEWEYFSGDQELKGVNIGAKKAEQRPPHLHHQQNVPFF